MLILAHRGASTEAPENTLAAFRLARAQKADGVELDVMRCGTGEVVVFHDDNLERLAHRRGLVRELPLGALREVNLGGGEGIPLLDEVLEETSGLLTNIELKTPPTWANRAVDDGLAREVAHALARHHAESRALVSSFDPLLLWRFRRLLPSVRTGLLFGREQSLPLRHAWARKLVRPSALHPEAALVDELSMRKWRRAGYAVNVWTVDEPAEIRCLAALGVDAIITNQPALARVSLG